MIAMILLIFTLVFFASQLRDDPLPTTAVAAQDVSKDCEVNMEAIVADEYGDCSNSGKSEA